MDYRNGKKLKKQSTTIKLHGDSICRHKYTLAQWKESRMPRHSKVEHIRVSVCQRRLKKSFVGVYVYHATDYLFYRFSFVYFFSFLSSFNFQTITTKKSPSECTCTHNVWEWWISSTTNKPTIKSDLSTKEEIYAPFIFSNWFESFSAMVINSLALLICVLVGCVCVCERVCVCLKTLMKQS